MSFAVTPKVKGEEEKVATAVAPRGGGSDAGAATAQGGDPSPG